MPARRVVLVTRPEPGLGDTMAALSGLGWSGLAAPMLRVTPATRPPPGRRSWQAVLLTSGQAVPALAALPDRDRLVLTVGDATADKARGAGFARTESAAGTAAELHRLATERLRPDAGPLLLLSGQGHGLDLARALRDDGFRVVRHLAYRSEPAAELDAGTLAALRDGAVAAVLFFSADAARTFRARMPDPLRSALAAIRAVAISERGAEPLRGMGWGEVAVAGSPNAAALLDRLGPAETAASS